MNDTVLLNRIKDTNDNLQFLSQTLTGLIKRVQELEKKLEEQTEQSHEMQNAIVLIAEELDMIIDEEEALT